MITAPVFVALFMGAALLCRRRGDLIGARTGWIIAAGCLAAWAIVAASPWWPLWLSILWTCLAAAILTQRHHGVKIAGVAILVELSALSYLLNYLTAIPSANVTAMANFFGIAALLALGGPHVGAVISDGLGRVARLGVAPDRAILRGGGNRRGLRVSRGRPKDSGQAP